MSLVLKHFKEKIMQEYLEKFKAIFNKYFVDYLKTNYTNFEGRVSRSQYWYFVLCYVVVAIPLGLIDGILFQKQVLSLILALALIVPQIGIGVRRLHDLGKPGWWYFMVLIPLVGPIALLVLFCMKGENKDNQYGKIVA